MYGFMQAWLLVLAGLLAPAWYCTHTQVHVLHSCSVFDQLRHRCVDTSCSIRQRLLAGGSAACPPLWGSDKYAARGNERAHGQYQQRKPAVSCVGCAWMHVIRVCVVAACCVACFLAGCICCASALPLLTARKCA